MNKRVKRLVGGLPMSMVPACGPRAPVSNKIEGTGRQLAWGLRPGFGFTEESIDAPDWVPIGGARVLRGGVISEIVVGETFRERL